MTRCLHASHFLVIPALLFLTALVSRGNDAPPFAEQEISESPPVIFISERPALLIQMDGDPILAQIEGTELAFVVNLDWNMLRDDRRKTFHTFVDGHWAESREPEGPWMKSSEPPADLRKIPASHPLGELARYSASIPSDPGPLPAIYLSRVPAALIVLEGAPRFIAVPGDAQLSYAANTRADLFLQIDEERYYVLLSGRWFRAARLEGPWEPASDILPRDFTLISPVHSKGRVLTSVPGTPQAAELVRLASIPHKARIKREPVELDIQFDGEPDFKPIKGLPLEFAANTSASLIRCEARYYCCHEGVWISSETPGGPWMICGELPESISRIPPSSPLFPVTFVKVYESRDDSAVVGYTAGYRRLYPEGGRVVFGTGRAYAPYVHGGVYIGRQAPFCPDAIDNPQAADLMEIQLASDPYRAWKDFILERDESGWKVPPALAGPETSNGVPPVRSLAAWAEQREAAIKQKLEEEKKAEAQKKKPASNQPAAKSEPPQYLNRWGETSGVQRRAATKWRSNSTGVTPRSKR